jgi:hypothetical protein
MEELVVIVHSFWSSYISFNLVAAELLDGICHRFISSLSSILPFGGGDGSVISSSGKW